MVRNDPVLTLLLDGHCIETTARIAFRDMERCALDGREVDESAYELLSEFLQATDFGTLRTERPILDGRRKVKVKVYRKGATFAIEEIDRLEG